MSVSFALVIHLYTARSNPGTAAGCSGPARSTHAVRPGVRCLRFHETSFLCGVTFTGLPNVVGEVGGQPAVRPDREQHELGPGVFELCFDEPLGCLLGQIPAGDGEHLFRGRRPVFLDDGALDGDVLVREFLALHRQAQYARFLDELCLAGLPAVRPCEEGDIAARLVTVPERHGQRRPVAVAVAGDAQNSDVWFGEELLALLFGHLSWHACSSGTLLPNTDSMQSVSVANSH